MSPASSRRLVIIGAGGHGREMFDVVHTVNQLQGCWDEIGFLDDGTPDQALLDALGARVLGTSAELANLDADYLLGIGSTGDRARLDKGALATGATSPVVAHPHATAGTANTLDPGVVLAAGVRLTTNITIGRHSYVNTNCTIGHDTVLGRYCLLAPGAGIGARVTIGDGVFIGMGAIVITDVKVGDRATIGAGSVVIRDVAPDEVVAGVPARPLRR